MSVLTVDDIINDRPSLRERAMQAQVDEAELKRALQEQAWAELRTAARSFARDVLLVNDADLDDIEYTNLTLSPRGEAVIFKVEGIKFRVKHQRVKVFQTQDHEAIYDDKPVFEMPARGPNGWGTVKTLADVGKSLEAFSA